VKDSPIRWTELGARLMFTKTGFLSRDGETHLTGWARQYVFELEGERESSPSLIQPQGKAV
jgi:hypothetical protein